MALDLRAAVQNALSRFGINTGAGRSDVQSDDMSASSNKQGTAHKRYTQDLIDKAADAKRLADMQAQTAQIRAQTAAFSNKLTPTSTSPSASTSPVIGAADQALLNKFQTSTKSPYSHENFKSGQQMWVPYRQAAQIEASFHKPNEGYAWSLDAKPGQTAQQWRNESLVLNPAYKRDTYKQAYDAIKRDFGLTGDSAQRTAEVYSQLNPGQLYSIRAAQLGVPMEQRQAAVNSMNKIQAAQLNKGSPPVYPGSGDWRAKAQYWKDLEAYNRR